MNETKFTPGPWVHDKSMGASYYKNCLYICDAPVNNEHDAHLIAAAPELYEALKFLLTCKHGEFCDHYREAETKARTVLAKARGE